MRHTAAILLTAGMLALTGCGAAASGTDAKPGASPTADPSEKFINSIIDAHLDSYADGIPAADELTAFPPQWCSALDAGHSVEWMFDETNGGGLYPVGENWGTEKTDAYQLVVLGVQVYCPKHAAAVKKELRESGAY